MVAAVELAPLGQEVVEVAAPAGRVGEILVAQAFGLGGVEHALDAAAQARGGLRLGACQSGFSTARTSCGLDLVDRDVAEGLGVLEQRGLPLLSVDGAAPRRVACVAISRSAQARKVGVLGGPGPSSGSRRPRASCAPRRRVSRASASGTSRRAEAELGALAVPAVEEGPALRAGRRDRR